MHPLDQVIETNFHRTRVVEKRRSSLDNSCLATPECLAVLLLFPEEEHDDYANKPARRLSLGTKLEDTNTTFLASLTGGTSANQKRRGSDHERTTDLDSDRHDIQDNSTGRCPRSSHSKATLKTAPFSSDDDSSVDDGDDDMSHAGNFVLDNDAGDDSLDDVSDCDSFCDASEEEPANRSYLRSDLGGSLMWSDNSGEGLDFLSDSWNGDNVPQQQRQSLGHSSSFLQADKSTQLPSPGRSPGRSPGKIRTIRSGTRRSISRSFAAQSPSSPVSASIRRGLSFKLAD